MNGVSTKQNGGGNLCHRSQPGLDGALGALGLLFQFAMQLVIASAAGGAGPAACWPIRGSLGHWGHPWG